MGANFLYIVFSAMCLSIFVACSSPEEKAREYNNQLVEAVSDASLSLEQFEQALFEVKDVQAKYEHAQAQVQADKKKLAELGTFNNDTLLINPALRLLSVYEKLVNNEYNTLREFHVLPPNQITFAITDSCKVIRMFVQNESTFAQQDFENAQQSFADRYHLELAD